MRILHYSLGFPPYRSGGLTKYCCDLMLSQVSRGHEVALVWPGRMSGRFCFKLGKAWNGIANYEMVDPLPVPYDEGVLNPAAYMEPRDFDSCVAFLRGFAPQVLHVHSTMGLPAEFIDAANSLGVRTVFTTHDYYPLCPRVTMFREGQPCSKAESYERCPVCNAGGLSERKIRLLQSPAYRALKDTAVVKTLRARHRAAQGKGDLAEHVSPAASAAAYRELLARNVALLEKFDVIHANSKLAAGIYRTYVHNTSISVVPIGNAETQEMRCREGNDVGNPIRLGYFGAPSRAKGYFVLLEALKSLWDEGLRFELNLYGPIVCDEPFAKVHPRYTYGEIDAVYQDTDLALVPSLWPETFGFQATEALCRGVPVAVSTMVGMKDILGPNMGVVFEPTKEGACAALCECLSPNRISEMRGAIAQGFVPPKLETVEKLYLREDVN